MKKLCRVNRKWINEKDFDWHCVSLHYYGEPVSAVVARGKPQLVLCFTIYRKVVNVNIWRLNDDTLYQKLLILV